jgi:hypothetical protein
MVWHYCTSAFEVVAEQIQNNELDADFQFPKVQ